jgi:glycosyltransferase involved in cell wall biosynthesis
VADELLVTHRGKAGGPPAREWRGEAGQRHPALAAAVADAADDRHSRLARALLAVSVALEPLQVTVDARSLGGSGVTGTTVHLVEMLGALTARDDVRVRALLPEQVGAAAAQALGRLDGLQRLSVAEAEGGAGRTHVVHRPWQIEGVQDMAFLDGLGERTVLTNQDLIGYRTPSVFGSVRAWQDYRRTTAEALGLAAMVVFFSETAAADALADDLVAPERTRTVPLGARPEHLVLDLGTAGPAPLPDPKRPFLLMLGNRFRHKNVRFALDLLAALRADHGWDGDLVLAGAEVLHGSSSGDDAAWRLLHPDVDGHVVELGAVGEAAKAWLLAHAAATVYPSTYEGFGLIPFEAAEAGTPALVASVSALRDTLPAELALLQPWDAVASARCAAPVLGNGPERRALVEGLRAAGAPLTWRATGEGLVAAYRAAIALPAPPAARLTQELARAEHDYWTVRDGIPDDVWALVRPDAPQIDEPLARDLAAVLARRDGRVHLVAALRGTLPARVARRVRRVAGR